jgi:hypothetical protein
LFYKTQLQEANLGVAWLRGAELFDVNLQGVNLAAVQLQGAILLGARLQGVHFYGTQLQGVRGEDDICDSFAQRMRQSIGQESALSGVTFSGGLSQENVDSLAKDLSDEGAKGLREKLMPHLGKPACHELPEDTDAITGAYTDEDAELWIAEYEDALIPEAPWDDS